MKQSNSSTYELRYLHRVIRVKLKSKCDNRYCERILFASKYLMQRRSYFIFLKQCFAMFIHLGHGPQKVLVWTQGVLTSLFFLAIFLMPLILALVNLIISIRNIKPKLKSRRRFGYFALIWQRCASLAMLFYVQEIAYIAIGLIALQA